VPGASGRGDIEDSSGRNPVTDAIPSARRQELLDAAYRYVLTNGAADLSLRPLAASTGTSPRVLLYLFGSKDGLVREILRRARDEQRELVRAVLLERPADRDAVDRLWGWLSAPERRDTIRLFIEAFARSLHPEPGPWEGFAQTSVEEWLELLDELEPSPSPDRTLRLAVLRGLLLDLLATGDVDRITRAYRLHRHAMASS
jgi:AcrR family transcriptional regulator